MKHDNSEAGYVKAKNPDGKFWVMQFKTGIHNGANASGDYGIFRRGKKWRLHKTNEGWVWQ
jgi:hypothetical protein